MAVTDYVMAKAEPAATFPIDDWIAAAALPAITPYNPKPAATQPATIDPVTAAIEAATYLTTFYPM